MTFDPNRLTSRPVTPQLREAFYTHDTDTQANMMAANYFNAAWAALPKGAVMTMVATLTGTPDRVDVVVTASSEAGGVTVALLSVA